MRVLIAFQGDSGSNKKVAETLKQELEKKGWSVTLQPLLPKKELKWFRHIKEYRKKKRIELKDAILDVKNFDLIFVGTPVWTYQPTPVVSTYLRSLKNTKAKRFALFATCVGFPGTTIKRMSSILSTKAARVEGSFIIRSIFELDEKKLVTAREFARELGK